MGCDDDMTKLRLGAWLSNQLKDAVRNVIPYVLLESGETWQLAATTAKPHFLLFLTGGQVLRSRQQNINRTFRSCHSIRSSRCRWN